MLLLRRRAATNDDVTSQPTTVPRQHHITCLPAIVLDCPFYFAFCPPCPLGEGSKLACNIGSVCVVVATWSPGRCTQNCYGPLLSPDTTAAPASYATRLAQLSNCRRLATSTSQSALDTSLVGSEIRVQRRQGFSFPPRSCIACGGGGSSSSGLPGPVFRPLEPRPRAGCLLCKYR